MIVWRKPATAKWSHDSAQRVDSRKVKVVSWTGGVNINFDATKDTSGSRHTTMRMRLEEEDVENLFAGLMKGRAERLEELEGIDKRVSKCRMKLATKRFSAKKDSPDQKFAEDLYRILFEDG